MKITANIATYPPRMHSLKQCVASLIDQVDLITICFNEYGYDIPKHFLNRDKIICVIPELNHTDNGKFISLDHETGLRYKDSEEYYFTCDDDLIYPPDYVEKTIQHIKDFNCIVTYHGRILEGVGKHYYKDHETFSFLREQKVNKIIDVCGTGCTAFDTRYFHPKGLASHKLQKMADLIFSLEAAKQGKRIGCCTKPLGWIKYNMHDENIYDIELTQSIDNQNELANQIYTLNHG